MALIKTLNVCSDNVAQRIQSYGSLSPSVLLNNELLDRIKGQTCPHAPVDTSGDLAWRFSFRNHQAIARDDVRARI